MIVVRATSTASRAVCLVGGPLAVKWQQTAKTLGIRVSPALLQRADRVIQ